MEIDDPVDKGAALFNLLGTSSSSANVPIGSSLATVTSLEQINRINGLFAEATGVEVGAGELPSGLTAMKLAIARMSALAAAFLQTSVSRVTEGVSRLIETEPLIARIRAALALLQKSMEGEHPPGRDLECQIARLIECSGLDDDAELTHILLETFGPEDLLEVANILLQSAHLNTLTAKPLTALRNLLGRVLVQWGLFEYQRLEPLLADILYPSDESNNAIERAYKLLKNESVASITDTEQFLDYVELIERELDSTSNPMPDISEEERAGLKRSTQAFIAGAALLHSDMLQEGSYEKPSSRLAGRSAASLLELVMRMHFSAEVLSELDTFATENQGGSLRTFIAYLLLNGDAELIGRRFNGGMRSEVGTVLFSELARIAGRYVDDADSKALHEKLTLGALYGLTVYALEAMEERYPVLKGSRVSKLLIAKAQAALEAYVIRSTSKKVFIQCGYRHSPLGHASSVLVSGAQNRNRYQATVVNTGIHIGDYHHPQVTSPLQRPLFPIGVESPLMTRKRLGRYLGDILPLRRSGTLQERLKDSRVLVPGSQLAMRAHYTFAGLKGQRKAYDAQQSSSMPVVRAQRGPVCVVKNLKRSSRMLVEDSNSYLDLRFLIKGLAHTAWGPLLKANGLQHVAMVELKEHVFKMLIHEMLIQDAPLDVVCKIFLGLMDESDYVSDTLIEHMFDTIVQKGTIGQAKQMISMTLEKEFSKGVLLHNAYQTSSARDESKYHVAKEFWVTVCEQIDSLNTDLETFREEFNPRQSWLSSFFWVRFARENPKLTNAVSVLLDGWGQGESLLSYILCAKATVNAAHEEVDVSLVKRRAEEPLGEQDGNRPLKRRATKDTVGTAAHDASPTLPPH